MHLFTIYGNNSKTQEMNKFLCKEKTHSFMLLVLILHECYSNLCNLKLIDTKALMLMALGQLKSLKLNTNLEPINF